MDAEAAAGTATNVLTMMLVKAAITSSRVSHAKAAKSFLPVLPMFTSITSPRDLPSCLTDANRAPKSCTPPKKIHPTITQSRTGTHPNMAAAIGPVIGPAPAMDAKW